MPFTQNFVDDGKGVHRIGTGVVTGPEMIDFMLAEAEDEERCRGLRYELVDFSATTQMKVTLEETRRIVAMTRRIADWAPGIVVAVVAPLDVAYGISRMWHSLHDDAAWKRNLFRQRAEALAWLRKQLPNGNDPGEYPALHPPPDMDAPAPG
jgi:hypothetical protein